MTAKRLIQNLTLFVVAIGFFACSTGEPSISRIPASIDYSAPLEFGMSFDASVSNEPMDGRVVLILTTREDPEPRFQVGSGQTAPLVFGVDVDGLAPGTEAVIGADVFGFPLESLAIIPPGQYYVQAVLHKYETFNLATGHTVKLPMDRGEGQQWNRAPGNLYSTPKKLRIDADQTDPVRIQLDNEILPIQPPKDTLIVGELLR